MKLSNLFAVLVALATLSTAGSALAAPQSGVYLDSVLLRQDTIRVDYGMKRGCGWLLNEDNARVQGKASDFCQTSSANHVVEYDNTMFDVEAGDELILCSQRNLNRCSGDIIVRAAGDLDDDGDINVIDLMLLHAYVMGEDSDWWPATDLDIEAADLNGDGASNVIDILLLVEELWN